MTPFFLLAAQLFLPVALPEVVPSPREMKSIGGTPFPVTEKTCLLIEKDAPESMKAACEMLCARCKKQYGVALTVGTWQGKAELEGNIVVARGNAAPDWTQVTPTCLPLRPTGHPEGYTIHVASDAVYVVGDTDRGSFYGMMTLLQLFQKGGIPCLAARDWPLFPIRATYGIGGSMEERFQTFASLKLNMVIWESSDYYHLDDSGALDRQKEFFRLCSKYCLEPVPEIQSWGHAYSVLSIDPLAAEGVTVTEELVLDDWETLSHEKILDLEECPIHVRPLQGSRSYERGRDFTVEKGSFPDQAKPSRPWRLKRKEDGAIENGETVRITYSFVPNKARTYCPSSARTHAIMKEAVQSTARLLKPNYIHIGHDEPERVNSDLRCSRRGLSEAEIIVEDVTRLRDWAHEINPDIRLMMWEDAVNPIRGGCGEAAEALPKEIIQCVWFYGTGEEERARQSDSLLYFTELGFECTGSPWYEPQNAYEWSQSLFSERRRSGKALGMIYTSWGNCTPDRDPWAALIPCAEYSWSPDKPFPVWLFALNDYFGCRLYKPSLPEMWEVMGARLNRVVVSGKDVVAEWKGFNDALRRIMDEAVDPELAQQALSPVRPAYSVLIQWSLGEEHAYWERSQEAERSLNALRKLLGGILEGEREREGLASTDLFKKNGTFPSSVELFDQFLLPKRPSVRRDGDVLFVPYTALHSDASHVLLADLGCVRQGIERIDFICEGAENVELSAGLSRDSLEYVLFEGGTPIVSAPPLFPEEPLTCRILSVMARPEEGKSLKLSHLRIAKRKSPLLVRCPFLYDENMVIDGRMTEDVWKDAALATDFQMTETGKLHPLLTECRLFVSKGSLVAAFRCQEPAMEQLVCEAKDRDSAVYNDDSVELFLDQKPGDDEYAHLVVNAEGVQYDERRRNDAEGWSPEWTSAAHKAEGEWGVEMVIPLEAFDAEEFHGEWGFNACRVRKADGITENLAFSPTGRSFHTPDRFGTLLFDTP